MRRKKMTQEIGKEKLKKGKDQGLKKDEGVRLPRYNIKRNDNFTGVR